MEYSTPQWQDHYAVLGVDDSANAKTIRKAYNALIVKYRSDVDKREMVVRAFKVLSDPKSRAAFDAELRMLQDWVQSLVPMAFLITYSLELALLIVLLMLGHAGHFGGIGRRLTSHWLLIICVWGLAVVWRFLRALNLDAIRLKMGLQV